MHQRVFFFSTFNDFFKIIINGQIVNMVIYCNEQFFLKNTFKLQKYNIMVWTKKTNQTELD